MLRGEDTHNGLLALLPDKGLVTHKWRMRSQGMDPPQTGSTANLMEKINNTSKQVNHPPHDSPVKTRNHTQMVGARVETRVLPGLASADCRPGLRDGWAVTQEPSSPLPSGEDDRSRSGRIVFQNAQASSSVGRRVECSTSSMWSNLFDVRL